MFIFKMYFMPKTDFKLQFFYFLLFVLFIFSCGKKTTNVITSTAPEGSSKERMDTLLVDVKKSEPSSENVEIENLPIVTPKTFVITSLEKTSCYGNCSSFVFQLLSNGEAIYEGREFVNRFGKFVAEVDEGTILIIKEKADELDIAELNSSYPTNQAFLNDLPLTISTIGNGFKKKTIKNNYDAPKALLEYEEFLEDLIEILEWRRADNP